jgi:hypothetical protein
MLMRTGRLERTKVLERPDGIGRASWREQS